MTERERLIVADYQTHGFTLRECAQIHRLTKQRIHQILVRLGIERRPPGEVPERLRSRVGGRGHGELHPDRNKRARELLADGRTYSQVAAVLNISRNAVAGIAHRQRSAGAFGPTTVRP